MPPATAASKPIVTALRLGQAGELGAVMGEQRLVRGDHGLAGLERRPAERQRRAVGAADQLDHEVDLRVGGERQRIVVPAVAVERDAALALPVARRDRDHAQLAPGAQRDQRAVLLEQAQDRAADRAEAGDADAQRRSHRLRPPPAARSAAGGRREKRLDVAHRLADPLPVLDQGEPDMALAILAEADPGRDRDLGLLEQELAERERADAAVGLGQRRPDEHRRRRRRAPASRPPARPSTSTSRRSR